MPYTNEMKSVIRRTAIMSGMREDQVMKVLEHYLHQIINTIPTNAPPGNMRKFVGSMLDDITYKGTSDEVLKLFS